MAPLVPCRGTFHDWRERPIFMVLRSGRWSLRDAAARVVHSRSATLCSRLLLCNRHHRHNQVADAGCVGVARRRIRFSDFPRTVPLCGRRRCRRHCMSCTLACAEAVGTARASPVGVWSPCAVFGLLVDRSHLYFHQGGPTAHAVRSCGGIGTGDRSRCGDSRGLRISRDLRSRVRHRRRERNAVGKRVHEDRLHGVHALYMVRRAPDIGRDPGRSGRSVSLRPCVHRSTRLARSPIRNSSMAVSGRAGCHTGPDVPREVHCWRRSPLGP